MATPYWEHRAALRQAAYDRANNKVVESVSRAYDRTMRQLDKDIDTIMATYTRKTGLTPREAYDFLREGVPQSVMDDLRSRAAVISDPRQRKRLEVMLRTDAYRARISRLDAIKASTRVGLTEAAEAELGALEPHLRHTADLAYSRTMFDIQHATSIGFQGVGVPRRALDTILKSRWAGTHYSTSVWQNRDAMAGILDRALMEQASMGKLSDMTMQDVRGMVDLNKWRSQVKSKFKTEAQYQKYAANRLIRTESAYVANQTTAVAYEECGIERYEYIATLDSRTSEKCGNLDGQIIDLDKKEVGVNYPPTHPHCRSSVAPVIDGLTREGLTRAARDANGKTVYVPRDMKYQEWQAWQKDGCPDIGEWRAGNAPVVKPPTKAQKIEAPEFKISGLSVSDETKYRNVLIGRFENGTSEAQNAYNKYLASGSVKVDGKTVDGTAYNASKRTIRMDLAADIAPKQRGPGQTWYHEHGHAVDHLAGYPSENTEFRKALYSDFRQYLESVKKQNGYTSDRDGANFIGLELFNAKPETVAGVSDLYGGLSKNWAAGRAYHREDYWVGNRITEEAFANMFEASFDPIQREVMGKYFPTAWEKFNRILGGI